MFSSPATAHGKAHGSLRFRGNHRKRKVVKPAGVNVAVPLVRVAAGVAGLDVTDSGRGRGGLLRAWRMAGRAAPARLVFCVVCICSVPGARVSCRTVRLCVVINRVLPGAAARPGSRQRAIELVQGAAGLPMVSGELMALRLSGLVPPPGGKLTGTAVPRAGFISCGRRGGHGGPGGDFPAAMRASRIVRVVITACSQRSSVAAHAVRACPPASRFPSRPVQRACLARRTLL